jgi:hypothetical protein
MSDVNSMIVAGADIVRPVHDARTPAFPEGSHQFDVRDPRRESLDGRDLSASDSKQKITANSKHQRKQNECEY